MKKVKCCFKENKSHIYWFWKIQDTNCHKSGEEVKYNGGREEIDYKFIEMIGDSKRQASSRNQWLKIISDFAKWNHHVTLTIRERRTTSKQRKERESKREKEERRKKRIWPLTIRSFSCRITREMVNSAKGECFIALWREFQDAEQKEYF